MQPLGHLIIPLPWHTGQVCSTPSTSRRPLPPHIMHDTFPARQPHCLYMVLYPISLAMVTYVFKAKSNYGDSYITTRFSNTQMNIVAISIFLSYNERLASKFPLLILDDPIQSLDYDHKEALAALMNDLSIDRQIIIATQNTEFKQTLEKKCSQIKIIELTEWSENGPIVNLKP
jgi:predicted ATPase